MLNDPLANVLSVVVNYEKIGRRELLVHPTNKLLLKVLSILQDNRYVGSVEMLTEGRGGYGKLNLLGNINKCGVIKPRFSISANDYEKFEKRYLPGQGVGILIVSTVKGLMTHIEARDQKIGGRLIAYCY